MSKYVLQQLHLKDLLSLGNAVSGLMAILASLPFYFQSSTAAIFFIVLAVVFDFLDGYVARQTGKSNEFGKQLDSLADVVSFGVAPVVLVLSLNSSLFAVVAGVLYLSGGLIRLARFNVQKEKKVYYGLPIPLAALFVAFVYYFAFSIAHFALAIAALLMVSRFKLKKLR